MTLAGKRALVTGASRGIGAAIAKALAAEGADVAITYEKSAEIAAKVVDAIKATGRKAVAIQADSADVAAVQASVDKTVKELGGLDILVNNAGILRLGGLNDISLADIDAMLNVNVRSPIAASKAALPHLGKGGRIITIGKLFCGPRALAGARRVRGVEVGANRIHEGAGAGAWPEGRHGQPRGTGLDRHRHESGARPDRGDAETVHGTGPVWCDG
ncbi:NAD(P)-dependent dehydrogenase (short-subunit alcohol dehydrogenase family) [Bradyrhizobium sp. S3.7.6]